MKSVYLDAGHGRSITGAYDSGAVDGKNSGDNLYTREATVNVDMVNRVKHQLAILSPDLKVLVGNIDSNLQKDLSAKAMDEDSLSEAVVNANKNKVNFYVSFHCNSSPSASAHGFQVFYGNQKSEGYAKKIQSAVKTTREKYAVSDRGITLDPKLYVLRKTTMPAVLIEIGFISNVTEEKLINNNQFREDLAIDIAKGIISAIG